MTQGKQIPPPICAEQGRPLILLKLAPSTWPPLLPFKQNHLWFSLCHAVEDAV